MHQRLLLVAFLLLSGCALAGTLPGTGSGPMVWEPAGEPRVVVIALHGFNDHKGSYAEFGTFAAARGVRVEAFDQGGFGERERPGIWVGTRQLVHDLHSAVREARQRFPGKPIHLLGESMGSAIAVVAAADPSAPPIDGLILTSPAIWGGADMPAGYRRSLRILATLVPPLKVSGRHIDVQASDNIEMLRALGRDPLYIRTTRIDAVAGLVELMDEARTAAPTLDLPMIVLRGARDEVVRPEMQARFVRELRARDCTTVTYLNGWHLLLRDLQREVVFADIIAWIEGQPLPSRLELACDHVAGST